MNWFKRVFTRRIEITIKTGPKSSLDGYSQNLYIINLNPAECSDVKTILAHELGHFMDNVADGMTKSLEQDYHAAIKQGLVTLSVLKAEASAWRNALKIYPKLDKKHLKFAFGTYQRSHKNPFWWMQAITNFSNIFITTTNQINIYQIPEKK